MIIDTSALIAILLGEPESARLAAAIGENPVRLMSAFSALETAVVIEARKGESGGRELDLLLYRAQIDIVPLNAEQMALARNAWWRFDQGQHPAGLNLGDCCAYALSKYAGYPLLFKGNDFSQTDLQAVIY